MTWERSKDLSSSLIRVILETPFAGEQEVNSAYARRCAFDCLNRGEAPFASHLIYGSTGVLREANEGERTLGIAAGLAWLKVCQLHVFYIDRGWSQGMIGSLQLSINVGKTIHWRTLDGKFAIPSILLPYEMETVLKAVDPAFTPRIVEFRGPYTQRSTS